MSYTRVSSHLLILYCINETQPCCILSENFKQQFDDRILISKWIHALHDSSNNAIHIFQLRQKILEAHTNVKDLNLLEAKMNFLKAWQSLPDYGVSLFVVRFHGEKREELLGVASNKIMRLTLNNADHIKTWRFSTMKVREHRISRF